MNFNYSRPLLKILPLIILIIIGLGCQTMETIESTKIPQSEIRQTYVVSATRERTNVIVYFNQGSWGKSVDLDPPSRIEDNGDELPQSSLTFLRGTVYEKSSAGVQTVHRFVYTNNDGKIFQNELSFEPLELLDDKITINRSQETKIRLSRAVGPNEKVSITLKSLEKRPDSDNSNAAPANSKNNAPNYDLALNNELDESHSIIILKPKNLKTFVNGKAILSIEISRELSLEQQNPAGGAMRWSYGSTVDVNVTN